MWLPHPCLAQLCVQQVACTSLAIIQITGNRQGHVTYTAVLLEHLGNKQMVYLLT
jgi:hypothetical protein